ncbi:MAG: LuxR C-terminal-related transcriptional regulator, partial [Actinomycetia bacterium]|nr:LuxR C-terminal-related transcriptional regulator [Actinomycetes bacterium]
AGLVHYIDAALALETSDNDKASAEAHTLQAMGDALESATLTALGMAVEGIVLIRRGELERGFGLLDEAMLPVVAEHVRPEFAGDIYCRIISVSVDLADLDRARHWVATMQRWCDGFSSAAMFAGVCRVHRAQLMREAGELDDAERDAQRTCSELADINRGTVGEASYELGEIHRLRGNLDEAATWYARAEQGGHSAEPGTSLLLLSRGQPKASLRRINAAVAAAESPFARARLAAARVEIALAAEEPGVAEQAANELDGIAARFGTVGLRASSLYAQGSLLLARGDCDRALAVLTDAHALYSRSARPYAQARVHALLARCYRARGQLDASTTHAEAASALFDRMRIAPPDSPVRTRHPGGLTDREIDVLRHVAAGESNRQIAAALTISDKTVGRHLSNIYGKLDLGSRSAATAWAYEHGLHTDDSLQHPM